LHVFTYSPRPGTPAADMRDQVPAQTARERNRILRDLAAEKKMAFTQTFVGKTLDAITLNVCDDKSTEALSDNYLKLRVQGQHAANQWMKVCVEQVEAGVLLANLSA
jgi:threonylcarbamoyladenosine tRNA methylthiotransferase MtaB